MRKILISLLATLVFNTAIAGVLYMLLPESTFIHNLIFAQCIGLTISLISGLIVTTIQNRTSRLLALPIGLLIAVAVGTTLASALTGGGSWHNPHGWQSMLIGLFFGSIGAIAYLLHERAEMEARKRQLIQSESEKREIEAHLKLLQAQIEPHFLFNTLANVSSLIDGNPALAKSLLERLNDWLRVALVRTRSQSASLGDELNLLQNYLEIMKIRFGDRLRWQIAVPDNARRLPFPPMLLQPLVENAVRHGIEPKVGGGSIHIHAKTGASGLEIEVSDDGQGLTGEVGNGTGLANIRARLLALFGHVAELKLRSNSQGGTSATLNLPIKETAA